MGLFNDEPEGFWEFLTFSAVRAVRHPKILIEVPPLVALKSQLDLQKHSAYNLCRAVRLVTDCSFAQASKVASEDELPSQLFRYKARVFLFALVRLMKPDIVMETGVGGGYASAHILEAMRLNEKGELYSIDNAAVYSAKYHNLPENLPCGGMVPQHLRRKNWHLNMEGAETTLLPTLQVLGDIDIFIHDSLHTKANMDFEYETAWNHLKSGGLLISHDIWQPWIDFCREKQREYLVYQHYGVAVR